MMEKKAIIERNRQYWDAIADEYQDEIDICVNDFHYGPLVPGDSEMKLLPGDVKGLRCYEFGCGAAQNSLYLASLGADCIASDISLEQLQEANRIAESLNLRVETLHMEMGELLPEDYGKFDLIHSSYALAFSPDPAKVIAHCARMLKPGGTLLFSTGHPLFSGEWLMIDDDEGLFLKDYFQPQPDIRYNQMGEEVARAVYYPIGQMADWVIAAGLRIERIVEPAPVKLDTRDLEEMMSKVPYFSESWSEYYDQLQHYPVVVIFKCCLS